LVFPRGVAPPAVVGNDGDELRAVPYVGCHVISPNGFIADNGFGTDAALRIENRRFILAAVTAGGAAESGEQWFEESEGISKGKLFRTGNQFGLVVELEFGRIFDQDCRVEGIVIDAVKCTCGRCPLVAIYPVPFYTGKYVAIFILL